MTEATPTEADIKATMAQVLRRIAPEADLNAVSPEENLRQALDLDSMDFLHFLVGLHEALDVDIPEADYGRLTTTARIVAYMQEATQERTAKE
jgi:acyl carrier protein